MAFRFKLDESLAKGVRRIGLQQIDRAALCLGEDATPAGIHGARKCLKRVRALLRLVRPGLRDVIYESLNGRFRDIARILSTARDRQVMLATLTTVEADTGAEFRELIARIRETLEAAHDDSGDEGEAAAREKARVELDAAARAMARIRLEPPDFQPIAEGLEAGLAVARRRFRQAYDAETDEAFHEWRKTIQHHWRQMVLLSRAWPELLAVRANAARELSQILGDDHDLGLLCGYLRKGGEAWDGNAAEALAVLCTERQKALRSRAEPLGSRLLADRPDEFARRVAVYWSAAAELARMDQRVEATSASKVPPEVSPIPRRVRGRGAKVGA